MQEEHEPTIEELKGEEQAGYEIPVEEDAVESSREVVEDLSNALRDLGRQFANTIEAAWTSQERREFESEVREGVDQFASEIRKAFREIKESTAAQKVKEETVEAKERVDSAEIARKMRSGLVEGLNRLSQELEKLADQFTPREKGPADVDVTVDDEEIV